MSQPAPKFIKVMHPDGRKEVVDRSVFTSQQIEVMKPKNGWYHIPETPGSVGIQCTPETKEMGTQTTSDLVEFSISDFAPVKLPGHMTAVSMLIVFKIFQFCALLNQKNGSFFSILKNTVHVVSLLTGLAESTIYIITSKGKDGILAHFEEEKKKKSVKKSRKSSDHAALERFPEGLAEELIVQFPIWWKEEKNVTLKFLQEWFREEFEFEACLATIGKGLRALGFGHRKKSYNPLVNGREGIVRWRELYVPRVKYFRDQGYDIFYFDETWIFSGMNPAYGWCPKDSNPYSIARQGDVKTFVPGPTQGTTRGVRAIVLAVLGPYGIVDGSAEVLISGKKPEDQLLDYHREMNSEVLEKYMEAIIPRIVQLSALHGKKAALVIDNASYHSRPVNKLPTAASKKFDLQAFLGSRQVDYDPKAKRPEQLKLAQVWIEQNGGMRMLTEYALDASAEKAGLQILRIPPYHCSLNAIEYVWGQLKKHLQLIGSPTDKLPVVRDRALAWLRSYSPSDAAATIEHVIATENQLAKQIEEGAALAQQVAVAAGDDEDEESDQDED